MVAGGVLNHGEAREYGFVQTDKYWRQKYHTIYKLTTSASFSGSVTEFFVHSTGGQHTTFSDWSGPVKEAGGNIGFWSVAVGWSSTYITIGGGWGPGTSIPFGGTGTYIQGNTILDGSPVYIGPPNYDHYNPAIPHL